MFRTGLQTEFLVSSNPDESTTNAEEKSGFCVVAIYALGLRGAAENCGVLPAVGPRLFFFPVLVFIVAQNVAVTNWSFLEFSACAHDLTW